MRSTSTEPSIVKPVKARDPWLDVIRGLLIILVVAGHVIGGMINTPYITGNSGIRVIYDWIYAFHMPAFFGISGLVMERSLQSRGPVAFVLEKARSLLYPYLIWGLISQFIFWLAQGYVNSGYDPNRLVKMLYDPGAGMWFLYALFLLSAAYAILWFVPNRPWTFFLLSFVGFACFVRMPEALPPGVLQMCHYGIYLACGVLLGQTALTAASSWPMWRLVIAFLGGFAALTSIRMSGEKDPTGGLVSAIFGITGLFGCSALITRIGDNFTRRFLVLCGQCSLEIYLVHPFTSVPFRIAIYKIFGISDAPIHFVIAITGGVLGSLLVAWIARKTIFRYLFRI